MLAWPRSEVTHAAMPPCVPGLTTLLLSPHYSKPLHVLLHNGAAQHVRELGRSDVSMCKPIDFHCWLLLCVWALIMCALYRPLLKTIYYLLVNFVTVDYLQLFAACLISNAYMAFVDLSSCVISHHVLPCCFLTDHDVCLHLCVPN